MKIMKVLAVSIPLLTGLALLGQAPSDPPAPTVDRIGFPTGYQNWQVLYVFDRPDNKSVRTIYGNSIGAESYVNFQFSYFYGSVIVMETQRALQDSNGNPILDQKGRFQKDPAATPTVFVMKKIPGTGQEYGKNQNGDWSYVAYHPDGTFQTTPQKSFSCAQCHLQAGQWRDWVFRNGLYFSHATGAVPKGVIQQYTYVPAAIHATAGSVVTIYNDDVLGHTVTTNQPGTDSSLIPGASATITIPLDAVGEIDFHCRIHPSMKGKIIIDAPQP